jgi:hypothetical protein
MIRATTNDTLMKKFSSGSSWIQHAHPCLTCHCPRNMAGSLPRGMPAVVDESVEVRERRTRGDTEHDVGRFGPSAWRNILRHVSPLDCIAYDQVRSMGICMGMSTRGFISLLIYSGGVGLQGKYPIWYYIISNTSCNLVVHADSVVRRTPWSCGIGHLWWCGPCLVLWVPGVIPPQIMQWVLCWQPKLAWVSLVNCPGPIFPKHAQKHSLLLCFFPLFKLMPSVVSLGIFQLICC